MASYSINTKWNTCLECFVCHISFMREKGVYEDNILRTSHNLQVIFLHCSDNSCTFSANKLSLYLQ